VKGGFSRLVLPGFVQNRLTVIHYYYMEIAAGSLLLFAVLIVVVG